MLKNVTVTRCSWLKRDVQRSGKSSDYSRIKKIEFWFMTQAFSERREVGVKPKAHQRIFKNLVVGFDRFDVDTDVTGDIRVIKNLAVSLCGDRQKTSEGREISYKLFCHDLF